MTQNLKIEVLTGDISIDGMVVTNLVTKEELSTAIVKKADLGTDGKIPTSQLPAEIVNTAGIVDEVKLQLETSIKDAVDESNAYAESYTDNAVSSKADLVTGKVPLEQLPAIDQYPQFGTALSNLSTSILTSVKQRTDELEKTKADLGEDGKVLREQIPSYEKISGLPEQLEVMSTQTAAVSGELDQHKLQTADQINVLKENIEANVKQLTNRQSHLMRNYATKELGVDANVGVKPGEYFYVRSANEEEMLVEYQNVGGVPTPSGKSYPSSSYVQAVAEFTALPFLPGESYGVDRRVQLDNGDIVKSTVAGNTVDPNVNMTGWVLSNPRTIVKTMADLRALKNVREGNIVTVLGYHAPTNFSLAQPYDGGGDFIWAGGSTVAPVQGIVEQVEGVATGRFLRMNVDGVVNVLWCGARRDGVTETHNELKVALQYAIDKDMQCYAPSGTYLLGNRVDPTFSNGKSLYFYGDGIDQTIFKEKDGLTAQIGRYNMSFYFLAKSGVTINSLVLRDFKVDKNGHTSMLTQAVIDSQGLYAYEQAHCIGISASWSNGKIKLCNVDNIETTDKVGAGLCFMAGTIDTVIINNIAGTDWQHNGGQRGDLEFQSVIKNLTVNNGRGLYAQCEPDVSTPPNGVLCKAEFNNCSYDSTEFTAFSAAPAKQHVSLSNHTALTKLTLRNLKVAVSDSVFKVSSDSNEYWSGLAKGSFVEDSEIIVKINTTSNQTLPFYVRSSLSSNNPTNLCIRGGVVRPDDTANSTTTGYAIQSQNAHSGNVEQKLILEDVTFDPLFERTIDCYGNGDYEIRRCKLAGRSSSAVRVGGYSSYLSNVVLEDNDLSQINGDYINFAASNTLWSLTIRGVHDFAKCGFNSNNLANTETCTKSEGYFASNVVPTGKGILGWRVKINKPAFGTGSEFICTTTHSVSPVYQLSAQSGVKMDTTANRPSGLTTASRGLRYLDTTLAAGGKPIQYNGTAWTDSLGATV